MTYETFMKGMIKEAWKGTAMILFFVACVGLIQHFTLYT
jgi:cbb3-type cytochrome oxidase subunit 3